MFKMIITLTISLGLGACVESIPKSTLNDGDENTGDIWYSAANKSQGGTDNQYDLLISTPADKDQLIICEADHPDKCNPNARQYFRISKLEKITQPRSFFLLRKYTLTANMVLAIKAWKTNDTVYFGRVVDLKSEGTATAPGAAPGTPGQTAGATKTYTEIASILNSKCAGCHNETAGSRRQSSPMNSYEAMHQNNVRRAYVENIVKAVKGTLPNVQKMPLNQGALLQSEIEALEAWERGGFTR